MGRVQALLRPSDRVKVAMEGLVKASQDRHSDGLSKDEGEAQTTLQDVASPVDYDAVLAIVRHGERTAGESGGVFLFRSYGPPGSNGFSKLVLERTLAVTQVLNLRVVQVSDTIDPVQVLCVEVSSGDKKEFDFISSDRDALSSLMSEYRELKELSEPKEYTTSSIRSWLAPYAFPRMTWISALPPQDLRETNQPLHTRLSRGCAGMPGDDAADYAALRDDWLHVQARSTARKDADTQTLRIRVGTFNVNGKLPSQDLSAWVGGAETVVRDKDDSKRKVDLIPPLKEMSPLSMGEVGKEYPLSENFVKAKAPQAPSDDDVQKLANPDLLLFAFQELDLSTEALLYSTKTTREEAWTGAIMAGLGEKRDVYEKLVAKQLVGMLILIFVRSDIKQCFVEAETGSMGAGIMGIMGNKGATGVRLVYRPAPSFEVPSPCPTTLTFVNAHLAAFEEMKERRNADFHDISRRLGFVPSVEYAAPLMPDGTERSSTNIYESDALIWMLVDLNYRINLPDSDVRKFLSSESQTEATATLIKFDQLKSSIRHKHAFVNFSEHPISFLPTYRSNYGLMMDSLGYDVKRKPAWTDRILHMKSPFISLRQSSYASHPSITMSDHRPISADFDLTLTKLDSLSLDTRANEVWESVKDFDPQDFDDVPALKLENTAIEFGTISYEKPVVRELRVVNVGKVPSAFRFQSRDLTRPIHPEWLRIEPMSGFLLPSEEMMIRFTIFVSHSSSSTPQLNIRAETIETMAILHTVLGKDHFISLSGAYEPTCFANSLSVLNRLPGPIRELRHPKELLPAAQASTAPREIMRLVNWLMSEPSDNADDLFFVPGDDAEVIQIRELLDTNSPFPDSLSGTPNFHRSIATTLLSLLDSLTEPVVPSELHARCAEVPSRDAAYEMLDSFSGVSVNVWISVTAFIHYLVMQRLERQSNEESPSQSSSQPGRTLPERYAAIFAPILLRDNVDLAAPVSPFGKRRFLQYFIQ